MGLSLVAQGHGREREVLWMMAGLGVLEHDAIVVERVVDNDSNEVVVIEVEKLAVCLACLLGDEGTPARRDPHAKRALDIGIDGIFCNLFRDAWHKLGQIPVPVKDACMAVDDADALRMRLVLPVSAMLYASSEGVLHGLDRAEAL